MRQRLKWFMGILLSLAMLLGLMMSQTAYAGTDIYSGLIPAAADSDAELTSKQVTFNGVKWYIIKDNSNAADAGTVTLLAADGSFGDSYFKEDQSSRAYEDSDVKRYLDSVITGTAGNGRPDFSGVAGAMAETNLTDVGVTGAKLYLLSLNEAEDNIPEKVLKPGYGRFVDWWLRSPGMEEDRAAYVSWDGDIYNYGIEVNNKNGVRPALKLNLSSVIFDSESRTFSLPPEFATLANGEVGGFTTPDMAVSQPKKVCLKKEITVYNPDGGKVNAPSITYNYAIASETGSVSVTDDATDHAGNSALTSTVKAGVGMSEIEITSSLSWTTEDELDAGTDGVANTKDIQVDFSDVAFRGAGVYRYKITETLDGDGMTYAKTGVTEGSGGHERFLDVYVKTAEGYTNGMAASDWDIYGYVCVANGSDDVNTATVKTNGFVNSSTETNPSNADKYYTYNLTLSNRVEGDSFNKTNTAFPFTVIFKTVEGQHTQTFKIGQTVGNGSTGLGNGGIIPAGSPANWNGVVKVKDSAPVKLTGIPAGVDVDVYETNIAEGTTYKVSTSVNSDDAVVDGAVTAGTPPTNVEAQGETKANYQSTKATVNTTYGNEVTTAQTLAITNTLVLISPTGLVLRFAPYALLVAGGLLLFFTAFKRRREEEAV
ncbi:MAG: DUF6273 domain-containing protein [Lachnospiraceae bacterium]|nr:DUF6273 domain-containing protein [Lachnospiraceae bacterium]